MINRPDLQGPENFAFEWELDIREARRKLFIRFVQLIWLGIAAYAIVAVSESFWKIVL